MLNSTTTLHYYGTGMSHYKATACLPLSRRAPGSVVGNFSPMTDDATELKDGDMVKMCAAHVSCSFAGIGFFIGSP